MQGDWYYSGGDIVMLAGLRTRNYSGWVLVVITISWDGRLKGTDIVVGKYLGD